jgi:hypothetical protein
MKNSLNLLAEVLEGKDEFKKPSKLNNRIDEFMAEIVKPEEDYRVTFTILNRKHIVSGQNGTKSCPQRT